MHGEYKVPGGKLVVADLEVRDGLIARAQVSGDFFLEPDSALDAMSAALHGLPVDAGEELIAGSVRLALGPEVRMYGITPEAVATAVRRALDGAPA
jgi:lipoate-protein ligase A